MESPSNSIAPPAVGTNHNSVPQHGQGASPGGRDGSMRTSAPQTGQSLGDPSGVREEMVTARLLRPEGRVRRVSA